MAVKKRGSVRDDTRKYKLICTGLSQTELFELYHALQDELEVGAAFRNPFLPQFDSHAIHEIMLTVAAIAGVTGREVLNLITAVVKRKLEERDAGKRSVTIYDHNGRPSVVVETKPLRRKR